MEEKIKEGIIAIIFWEIFAMLFTLCDILLWTSSTADIFEKIAFTILLSIFVGFLIFGIVSNYKDILKEIKDYKTSMLQDINKLIEKQNKEKGIK